eukprot:gene3766-2657_t
MCPLLVLTACLLSGHGAFFLKAGLVIEKSKKKLTSQEPIDARGAYRLLLYDMQYQWVCERASCRTSSFHCFFLPLSSIYPLTEKKSSEVGITTTMNGPLACVMRPTNHEDSDHLEYHHHHHHNNINYYLCSCVENKVVA